MKAEILSSFEGSSARLMAQSPSHHRRPAWILLVMSLLAGCTLGPDFLRPKAPEVNGYTSEPLELARRNAEERQQSIAVGEKITGDWWKLFSSERLNFVLQQAVEEN